MIRIGTLRKLLRGPQTIDKGAIASMRNQYMTPGDRIAHEARLAARIRAEAARPVVVGATSYSHDDPPTVWPASFLHNRKTGDRYPVSGLIEIACQHVVDQRSRPMSADEVAILSAIVGLMLTSQQFSPRVAFNRYWRNLDLDAHDHLTDESYEGMVGTTYTAMAIIASVLSMSGPSYADCLRASNTDVDPVPTDHDGRAPG